MSGKPRYQSHDPVFALKTGRWVRGRVMDRKEEDGVWKYFVQLADPFAAQTSDPANWYTDDQLRPAPDSDD